MAVNLGTDHGVFDPLVENIDTAPVREELKPPLRVIRIPTLTPTKVTKDDAAAVFAAGWDEQSFHQAIAVCAGFATMNRLTLGHGLVID